MNRSHNYTGSKRYQGGDRMKHVLIFTALFLSLATLCLAKYQDPKWLEKKVEDIELTRPRDVREILVEIEAEINRKQKPGEPSIRLVADGGVKGFLHPQVKLRVNLKTAVQAIIKALDLVPISFAKDSDGKEVCVDLVGNTFYINSRVKSTDYHFKKLTIVEESILEEVQLERYFQRIRFDCFLPALTNFERARRAYLHNTDSYQKYPPMVIEANPHFTVVPFNFLNVSRDHFQKGMEILAVLENSVHVPQARLRSWYTVFYYYMAFLEVYANRIPESLNYIEKYLVLNALDRKEQAKKNEEKDGKDKKAAEQEIADQYRGILKNQELRSDKKFLIDIFKLKARCYLTLVEKEELKKGFGQNREMLKLNRNRLFETYKLIIETEYKDKKIQDQLIRKIAHLKTKPVFLDPKDKSVQKEKK